MNEPTFPGKAYLSNIQEQQKASILFLAVILIIITISFISSVLFSNEIKKELRETKSTLLGTMEKNKQILLLNQRLILEKKSQDLLSSGQVEVIGEFTILHPPIDEEL